MKKAASKLVVGDKTTVFEVMKVMPDRRSLSPTSMSSCMLVDGRLVAITIAQTI